MIYLDREHDDTVWTTAEGDRIPIREMDDQHLTNTIRWMRRNQDRILARYRMSVPEYPMFNGEMAQYYAEQDWEYEVERRERATRLEDIPAYNNLIDEAGRRRWNTMPSVQTKVVGVTFHDGYPANFHKWSQRTDGQYPNCTLVREPDNEHDPNAVAVKVGRSIVGHVPRELAVRVAEVMDSGTEVTARVVSVETYPDMPSNPTMTIEITR